MTTSGTPQSTALANRGGGGDGAARAFVADTEGWAREVAELLRRQDRPQAAGDVEELLAQPEKPQATVVVAGEDKRGKSSLVNALLRSPGLSPVGVETVTATPIRFFQAPQTRSFVHFHGDPDPHELPLEEARSLATLQGNPMNERNVREVEIGVPAPLLERIVLVDTPGVGGLDSGHAALTLQSLRSADALIFVIEAGAQMRGPELRFLREAAARTSRVIFALTKVDQYHGWRQVAADNAAILQQQAPRFAGAPMLPVSNQLGLRAARLHADDPDGAEELWAESGLAQLERTLRGGIAADLHLLRAANLAQTCLLHLAGIERGMSERVAAVGSPQEAQDALVAERARLSALSQEKAEWPQMLAVEMRRLNLDRSERIATGLANIRRRYEERLRELKKSEQDQLPGELVAELTALAGEMNQWTVDRLGTVVTNLVGSMDQGGAVTDSIRQLTGDALTAQLAATPIAGKLKATDKITVLSSYSSGHALVALLATGGIGLTPILGPVGLVCAIGLGSVFAFSRFRVMRQTNYAAQFRPWMADQASRLQVSMNNSFQRVQIDVEVSIRQLLKAAFAERERQLTDTIAACQRMLQQEQGERQRQRQALTTSLDRVRALRATGQGLLRQLAP